MGYKALYGVLNRRNQIISENSCEIYANKRTIQFLMLNPKLKHHKALCGVLNRPQSALWCFDYGCFIKHSEQETVRKQSGHKMYSSRNFFLTNVDAKK